MTKQEKLLLGLSSVFFITVISFGFYKASVSLSSFSLFGGERVTAERSVENFNRLYLDGSIDVFVEFGQDQKVEVFAPENIINNITTDVSNGTLRIGRESGFFIGLSGSEIHITVESLEEVKNLGSGDIKIENLIETPKFRARVIGSGDIKIDNIKTQKLIFETVGSGDISIKGEAEDLEIEVIGSGNYRLFDLNVKTAKIEIFGSGDVDVNVSEKLDIKISGGGDLEYKGEPKVEKNITGSGSIEME